MLTPSQVASWIQPVTLHVRGFWWEHHHVLVSVRKSSVLPSQGGTPSSRAYYVVGSGEKMWADVRGRKKNRGDEGRDSSRPRGGQMIWREHTTWWGQKETVLEGSSAVQRHGCCSSKHHCQLKSPTWKFSKWHFIFRLGKGEMVKPEKKTVASPAILLVGITVNISVRMVTNSHGFLPDETQDKLARV